MLYVLINFVVESLVLYYVAFFEIFLMNAVNMFL